MIPDDDSDDEREAQALAAANAEKEAAGIRAEAERAERAAEEKRERQRAEDKRRRREDERTRKEEEARRSVSDASRDLCSPSILVLTFLFFLLPATEERKLDVQLQLQKLPRSGIVLRSKMSALLERSTSPRVEDFRIDLLLARQARLVSMLSSLQISIRR